MGRSIGLSELFVLLLLWGIPIFCIWKFYQMLSKINDNVAGIRRAVERNRLHHLQSPSWDRQADPSLRPSSLDDQPGGLARLNSRFVGLNS
jgi:hypothetical protein